MKTPIFVRPLSEEERESLQKGLRSKDTFTLRRSQMLLASSRGERAGATITEVEGSHVIMMSQPQVVAEAILTALAAAPRKRSNALIGKDNVEALV
jgi:hypothetical protein